MLVFAKDEVRQSRELITSLWMHELKRTVQDQLCRQADLNWFHLLLKNTIEKVNDLIARSCQLWVLTENFSK